MSRTTGKSQARWITVLFIIVKLSVPALAQVDTVKIDWNSPAKIISTTPTLQVVVNAALRRDATIHDPAFKALKEIGCDYVRFCPWYPYPKLGVAELEAPANGKTSWDFTLMDPIVEDFMNASQGRPVVMTFSTMPQWMWKAEWHSGYPENPNQEEWVYNSGMELNDPSGKQVGQYFRRVFEWYTKGGFTDELGKKHVSNHHYNFKYWEVLNEPEVEHFISPKVYNTIYDATVAEIRKVDPSVKFVGASLMRIREITPDFMETFLNPKNHKAQIPLDYVSYHAYVWINQKRGADAEQYTAFEQARQFIEQFYFIDAIRKRLSPTTKTMINEVGTIRSDDPQNGHSEIEPWYWSLSAATYAYLYAEMADMGVDVVGMSQLVGYQYQFPCVTMIDWKTGQPNLRYYLLKLIKDNIGSGDKLLKWSRGVDTQTDLYSRAFVGKDGKKKILLVNMRNKKLDLTIPGITGATVSWVDDRSLSVQSGKLTKETVSLNPFGVSIVTLP